MFRPANKLKSGFFFIRSRSRSIKFKARFPPLTVIPSLKLSDEPAASKRRRTDCLLKSFLRSVDSGASEQQLTFLFGDRVCVVNERGRNKKGTGKLIFLTNGRGR